MAARGWLIGGMVGTLLAAAPEPSRAQEAAPAETATARPEFTFQGPDGHTYAGRIEHPPEDRRTGFAVVMLGGGIANDLDWTVPAEYAIDGIQTRDGAHLAASLAARGFVVMRWETIPTDGDWRAQWPNVAVFRSYPETLEHARAALRAFRDLRLVEDQNVILLGHSLGATRACQLAESDGPLAGLVLLSGAHLTRTGHDPAERQSLAAAWIAPIDASGDGTINAEEYDAAVAADSKRALAGAGFGAVDRDGDGQLSPWEVAAQLIIPMRRSPDAAVDLDKDWRKYTLSRPEDVLSHLHPPVLLVYGGLDGDHAVHGPILEDRAAAETWPDFQVRYFPRAGHQLGPEAGADGDTKYGPMEQGVIDAIGQWLEARFHR